MPAIIETKDLTKRYGPLVAVDALSLSVEQGAIYGFVGPNGAGKTTTMRMMTTLLRPTSGEAWVAGASITRDPRGVRRAIGYMPDFFGVYDDMKVWEYLDFFAACYEIPEVERKALINDLLELVSGLAPRAGIEIRELLVELSRLGKTIFFSTHILTDVAEICTQVGIVEAGKLVAQGSLDEMQRRLAPHRRLHVTVLGKLDEARQALTGRAGVLAVKDQEASVGASAA